MQITNSMHGVQVQSLQPLSIQCQSCYGHFQTSVLKPSVFDPAMQNLTPKTWQMYKNHHF